MPLDLSKLLVIGVSSRALFDLEDEARIYERLGLAAYQSYQLESETDALLPGTAFPFIKGLLSLNKPGQQRQV
jgi:5'-nucleotidase